MNNYYFWQCCRPISDFRVKEIINFLILMKEGLRISEIYDKNNKKLELSKDVLNDIFEKKSKKLQFPGVGITIDFFSIPPKNRDENTVRFEIHTGTNLGKKYLDTYDISIGQSHLVPNLSYFKKSIEIFKPFEAYLAESFNERNLNSFDRQQAHPGFTKPAIIRGFHYMDEKMANSIGGIENCLKAPAWKVEKFCEGVLIQLTEGLFDNDNLEHRAIQEKAMRYFKIWNWQK